ncbi:hypothetical protein Hanom_Chr16g01448731 [Helianthus anomalus]
MTRFFGFRWCSSSSKILGLINYALPFFLFYTFEGSNISGDYYPKTGPTEPFKTIFEPPIFF